MPIEAADLPRGRPDRRKPILVLCTWSMWTDDLRAHIGDRYRLQIPTDTRMSDLGRLSEQQSWRLVLMTSVDAVVDQRLPLEALRRWPRPYTQPVVVLSPFPTLTEKSNSEYAGAILYSEMPWIPKEIDAVLSESFRLAQRARRLNRVGVNLRAWNSL